MNRARRRSIYSYLIVSILLNSVGALRMTEFCAAISILQMEKPIVRRFRDYRRNYRVPIFFRATSSHFDKPDSISIKILTIFPLQFFFRSWIICTTKRPLEPRNGTYFCYRQSVGLIFFGNAS